MAQDITHVDYEELGQVAAQFGQQSEESQALQQAIKAAYEPLAQGDWQGVGVEAFVAEMGSLMFPGMERLHTALSQAQRVTIEVSQLIRQAEEEAAGLFGGEHGGAISGGAGASGGQSGSGEKSWWQRGIDMVRDAGDFLRNQGERALNTIENAINTIVGAATDLTNTVITASDKAIDNALSQIIPKPGPGGAETITVKLDGSLTIPGIEVGVPGSLRATGAKTATLTHNPDGTYSLTISDSAGAGVVEPTGGIHGSATVGGTKVGGGAGGEASVMLNGGNSITIKFDPNKPGDMTKMAALGGSIGMPGFPQVAAGPILASLKDNITSVKLETGVDANISGELGSLINGAGGGGIKGSGEVKLNDSGQREVIQSVQITGKGSIEGDLKVVKVKGGGEVSVQLQSVHNLDTGTDQAKVTVTLRGTGSRSLATLERMLPPGAVITKGSLGLPDASGRITVEYTLNQPAETVRDTFLNGGSPDLGALAQQSTLTVKVATGSTATLGAEGSIGEPTQQIGIAGNATVTRESESTVLKYDGPNNQISVSRS